MMLDMQASLLGLHGWEEITALPANGQTCGEECASFNDADKGEFYKTKGEDTKDSMCHLMLPA